MKLPKQILEQYGYRQITSEIQATHLLRRELKQMHAASQRSGRNRLDAHKLLSIRPGMWFRFVRRGPHSYGSILILSEVGQ